jgi:erythromycin esterase-like protein
MVRHISTYIWLALLVACSSSHSPSSVEAETVPSKATDCRRYSGQTGAAAPGFLDDASAVPTFLKHVRKMGGPPLELLRKAVRQHPIIFIGEAHTAADPKRLLVEAMELMETEVGLDVLALEIPSREQGQIDAYLASNPEDTAILKANPRLLFGDWGASEEYLAIYRAVWRLNQGRPASDRVRIVAAEHPDWPPSDEDWIRMSPSDRAKLFEVRDIHMFKVIDSVITSSTPTPRILIFMGAFHSARAGRRSYTFGQKATATYSPVGALLDQRYPGKLFSVMVDGMGVPEDYGTHISCGMTPYFDILSQAQPPLPSPWAVPVDDNFAFVSPYYQYESSQPLQEIEMNDAFDLYIYVAKSSPTTLLAGS